MKNTIFKIISGLALFISNPAYALAQVYGGGGVAAGVDAAVEAGVGTNANLGTILTDITVAIVKYTALLATIVIIIGGIWLIVGVGDEQAKERAKKIVLFTLIGVILVAIAGAIVTFIQSIL
ncbi:hypothetical protein KJ652_04260 [Patescibacteria group bacterium]|nr:hypothetical protein [Patescibacteria group bacterium]MBU1123780.1 hypothetical protein [Patescibacteria group bacterium]MBU1910815.1 hypothetical protein [Patescibacteria group bacterium]